uniref:Piezo_RRas_bdg domain-containing protein n=1 Tax=Gongylonema pulchrum TaxID=637853 RepID=A0A183D915_9BILA
LCYRFTYERPSSKESKEPSQHSYALSIPLPVNSTIRNNLAIIIRGQYNESILLEQAWPPYVIVPNEGDLKPAHSLLDVMSQPNLTAQAAFSNVSMKLKASSSLGNRVWTAELVENNETAALTLPLDDVRYGEHSEKYMQMIAFVDRVFPSFATKFVQGGYFRKTLPVLGGEEMQQHD